MLRRLKHSKIEVVAPKEEELVMALEISLCVTCDDNPHFIVHYSGPHVTCFVPNNGLSQCNVISCTDNY